MRKLISMSVMALLLSVMASMAVAGNVEDCEILEAGDYSKGLYGLCIAYYNAGNDNARQRILDNYDKKAQGPNDPAMPGTEDEDVFCPCWDDSVLADALADGEIGFCFADPGFYLVIADSITQDGNYQFTVNDLECFYQNPGNTGVKTIFDELTPAEAIKRCKDDIVIVCE